MCGSRWLRRTAGEVAMMLRCTLLVFIWEDRYNDPAGCAIRLVENLPNPLSTKVYHETSCGIESIMCIGVFWPVKIYTEYFGEAKKSDLEPFTHNGQSLRGVWRDPKHGKPPGTILVNQKSEDKAKRV